MDGIRQYLLNDGTIRVMPDRFGTGAKLGNVKLPDFKKQTYMMYTKTEPSMSDEELKEAIAKIAREDAEKGKFHNMTKEYIDLEKEYVSSVSPDRESIITDSMKEINSIKQTLSKANSPEQAKSLLQLFIEMEEGDNKNKVITISGTMYNKACFEGDKLMYVEFHDSNGETIADYSPNNGWGCLNTNAEIARKKEFSSIYNEAWRGATASVPKHLDGGATIDAYA